MTRRVCVAVGMIAALLVAPVASSINLSAVQAAVMKTANEHGCC